MSRFDAKSLWHGLRGKSQWVLVLNSGSCGGCEAEIEAAFGSRYGLGGLGVRRVFSPKHADVVLITGPVANAMRGPLLRTLEQVPHPRVVLALGECAADGGPFAGSDRVAGPVGEVAPVDIWVPGCPPHPRAIVNGLMEAAALLGRSG